MEKLYKYFCAVMTIVIILSSTLMVFAFEDNDSNYDLFDCQDLVQNIKNCELNMTSIIYAQNKEGKWEEYQRIHGTENRIWVDIENIPQNLIDAIIAIEDQRFYSHAGVDWKRTTSAFINYLPFVNIYSSNQGGSTITQQLIKNLTSDKEQNALRKIREIARATLIEKMLDKTTILEAYLNTISLGNGICGVQVASNYYFNKDVKDLTLAECASLAAITKNPSAYNPESKPKGNKKRRQDVLSKMVDLDMISMKEFGEAYISDVVVDTTQKEDFEIPINNYFVDALIDEIINEFSIKYNCSTDTASSMLYNGGYRIYATIDPEIQGIMEEVYTNVNKYFPQKSRKDKSVSVQSAMTIVDYNGNIKGIVGGVGEKTVNRGLNRATESPRQPGSTMKPIGVYTLGIENDLINFSTAIEDKPMEKYYADGKAGPREWYGEYLGDITVKYALERSANTIPCWVLRDMVGIDNSFNFLTEQLGMKHLSETDKNVASLALGGCEYGITTTESAAAYAIYGNGGIYYEPRTYVKVINADDEVILESNYGKRVIKETTATIMNRLLQNVVYGANGTGGGIASYNGMRVYAKTGTSSESNDLWMVAGTPYYVGSVWYGFDQPEAVYNAGAAASVWRNIMAQVHKGLEKKEFTYSEEIFTAKFCERTGLRAIDVCTETGTGYYVKGTKLGYCSGVHPEKETEGTEETPQVSEETPATEETPETPEVPPEDTSSDTSTSSETTSSGEGESSESESSSSEGESSSSESSDTDSSSSSGEDGNQSENNSTTPTESSTNNGQ